MLPLMESPRAAKQFSESLVLWQNVWKILKVLLQTPKHFVAVGVGDQLSIRQSRNEIICLSSNKFKYFCFSRESPIPVLLDSCRINQPLEGRIRSAWIKIYVLSNWNRFNLNFYPWTALVLQRLQRSSLQLSYLTPMFWQKRSPFQPHSYFQTLLVSLIV